MSTVNQGWAALLRLQGSEYLAWLAQNKVMSKKLNALSNALWSMIRAHVRTPEQAMDVWKALPSVICRCNEQETYELPGADIAYAWLHLLERYARTWIALEELVKHACLPMAKYGVRALDVGTGPGSSAFAIHDFFAAMTEFSNQTGNTEWRQPPQITCVELARRTNHFRHLLAETIYEQSGRKSVGVLAMCHALHNFEKIMPTVERKELFMAKMREVDEYYDDVLGAWTSDVRYMPDEASAVAQSLHRYRLFMFSNFFTTPETVGKFRSNLVDVLVDAAPGSVIMVLGGRGGPYPHIYDRLEEIARSAGFRKTVVSHDVSIEGSIVEDSVYDDGKRFYGYLQDLAASPGDDEHTQRVCSHFEGDRSRARPSRLTPAYSRRSGEKVGASADLQ